MDMDDKKSEDSFEDIDSVLIKLNTYQAEQEGMIRVLEHMERDLRRTVKDLESLRELDEDCLYYRVSGMPKMKVRDVLPYSEQEKMKKERQIEQFRKKIIHQNEEMIQFKNKHLKIMDPRDMPSTSYDKRF